jgi:hypothetical protein
MRKTNCKYRLKDDSGDYEFNICEISDGWRAYIIFPDDNEYKRFDSSRKLGSVITHRLEDSIGQYICWTNSVQSYKAMRQIIKVWSEGTAKFIRTGVEFGGPA